MLRSDNLTQIADVTASTIASDGQVRVNIGDAFTGKGFAADAPLWGLDGFVSRPNDPDADGAAQVLYLVDGDNKRAFASRDNRWASKAGNLAPGDRAIVSNCDARMFVKKERNAVTLYTVNEKDDGHSMLVDLAGKDGNLIILNGSAQIRMTKDSITLGVSGGGAIVIDKDGVQVLGAQAAINCSTVTIGLMGGAPPPPGSSSACVGPTGMAAIGSHSVTIAP